MRTHSTTELLRRLPSVDELLRHNAVAPLAEREGHTSLAEAARAVLARLREEISNGALNETSVELAVAGLAGAVEREVRRRTEFSLRRVINATGVVLHTNLGRAPLATSAMEHIGAVATRYSNLEFEVERGERGKRDVHAQRLLASIFGADTVASVVVNNNAAAVLLLLNTLAEGGEVIVSRGELVEIGGSFRVPEVMAKSGATLREVGTTNRTRVADYEQAINERTRLILRVHRSNFAIVGFTEQPSLAELARLAHSRNVALAEDLGSGALFDLRTIGVNEPSVSESLRAGVDVVTYSGDKLLGGPQAGIITGRKDLVSRMRSNPLFRALRVDKLTYAALEATLLAYVRDQLDEIPAVRMMRLSAEVLRARAESLQRSLAEDDAHLAIAIVPAESVIGGGAAPSATLPTFALAVTREGMTADELSAALRRSEPPIVARVEDGRVLLDLRTVFPDEDELITTALVTIGSSKPH